MPSQSRPAARWWFLKAIAPESSPPVLQDIPAQPPDRKLRSVIPAIPARHRISMSQLRRRKSPTNTVVASAGSPPTARPLTPDKTEPSHDSVDTRIFGTRRHYSMRLSMPNLTSSTGSWSIRFAELNATHGGADLSAPEAISKVDPAYPQDLMHDRVEGTVVLYAVIHADGSVGDVKVLEGFDDRLNENARKALEQWRFRPGTKDGMPVDIEAVVRVPFKVPRRDILISAQPPGYLRQLQSPGKSWDACRLRSSSGRSRLWARNRAHQRG